jgi:hypothetical protein
VYLNFIQCVDIVTCFAPRRISIQGSRSSSDEIGVEEVRCRARGQSLVSGVSSRTAPKGEGLSVCREASTIG